MDWKQKPDYPLKPQLRNIARHDDLPEGAVELASVVDKLNFGENIYFIRQGNHLSILEVKEKQLKDGSTRYRCTQNDFPLGVLSWFGKELSEFRKSPAQGGMHAGAMSSADEVVEGEMLCLQRAMDAGNGQQGYILLNRSRKSRLVAVEGHFEPQRVVFADNLLTQGGLLDLIKDLGDKYQRGALPISPACN